MQNNLLTKILFLDIETVPLTENPDQLPEELSYLWEEKCATLKKRNPEKYPENATSADLYESAGIFAEFGKIICISVGFIYFDENNTIHFRTRSYTNKDERLLLIEFSTMVQKFCNSRENTLCGHNIKEFDIPYICRRMLINGLQLPNIFQIAGKKPWEINFIDTLELWKFGDFKHYTPLKLLTAVFNIPTPKDDIDGSQVAQVYYQEKNIERIALYCQKDVLATAQVYLKLNGYETIDPENVEYT